jgi:hypothetical protein
LFILKVRLVKELLPRYEQYSNDIGTLSIHRRFLSSRSHIQSFAAAFALPPSSLPVGYRKRERERETEREREREREIER